MPTAPSRRNSSAERWRRTMQIEGGLATHRWGPVICSFVIPFGWFKFWWHNRCPNHDKTGRSWSFRAHYENKTGVLGALKSWCVTSRSLQKSILLCKSFLKNMKLCATLPSSFMLERYWKRNGKPLRAPTAPTCGRQLYEQKMALEASAVGDWRPWKVIETFFKWIRFVLAIL